MVGFFSFLSHSHLQPHYNSIKWFSIIFFWMQSTANIKFESQTLRYFFFGDDVLHFEVHKMCGTIKAEVEWSAHAANQNTQTMFNVRNINRAAKMYFERTKKEWKSWSVGETNQNHSRSFATFHRSFYCSMFNISAVDSTFGCCTENVQMFQ